jgi:eukaryotic-like serine/threonine-protein kinase
MTDRTDPVVLGRYLLCDVIGGGGMATVHVGRALGAAGFSRVVAIKRLHAARANDPQFTTMLADEARLVSRIRHPNVVPTIDVLAIGREVVLVMEYVHGVSVAQLVRLAQARGERVPRPIAARIVLDILAGLGAAHAATSERGRPLEIVHRDVSPQNVLVDTDGSARLVDFGVAKAVGKLGVTREGEIKGKLAYMAPEQLRGEEVDLRADLYASGIMLWELVAGRQLFDRSPDDLAAAVRGALAGTTPSLREVADAPEALAAVTTRALATDRADRFESASAMAAALEAAGPAATAKEVAAFVTAVAGDALAERSTLVANVEQLSQIHDRGPQVAATLETARTELLVPETERLADLPTHPQLSPFTQPLAAPLARPAAQPLPPPVVAAPASIAKRPPLRAIALVLVALGIAALVAFFVLRSPHRRVRKGPDCNPATAGEPHLKRHCLDR